MRLSFLSSHSVEEMDCGLSLLLLLCNFRIFVQSFIVIICLVHRLFLYHVCGFTWAVTCSKYLSAYFERLLQLVFVVLECLALGFPPSVFVRFDTKVLSGST